MRVLYVNHTAEISGGEHSLLGLIDALPNSHEPHIACPSGPLADAAASRGVPVHGLGGAAGGPRVGPGSIVASGRLAADAMRINRLTRNLGVDIVHANSLRAGVAACVSQPRTGPGAIVHIRDCWPPRELLTRASRTVVAARAAAVIANSEHTRRSFTRGVPHPKVMVTVHNGVDLKRFDPATVDAAEARRRLCVRPGRWVLGVAAQLTPWKRHEDAVEILRLLVMAGHDVELLLAGSAKFLHVGARHDHLACERKLRDAVTAAGLANRVTFLGERSDMPDVFAACDIVLVPSLEEPFGRVLLEAMAMEVPVVATSVGGPPEIVRDGVDGLLLPPNRPGQWSRAVEALLTDVRLRRRMGRAGRERVSASFEARRHAEGVLRTYERILGETSITGSQ